MLNVLINSVVCSICSPFFKHFVKCFDEIFDEPSITSNKFKEILYFLGCFENKKFLDCLNFPRIRFDAIICYHMSKKFYTFSENLRFIWLNFQTLVVRRWKTNGRLAMRSSKLAFNTMISTYIQVRFFFVDL